MNLKTRLVKYFNNFLITMNTFRGVILIKKFQKIIEKLLKKYF